MIRSSNGALALRLLLGTGELPVLLRETMIRFFESIGSPLFLHSHCDDRNCGFFVPV